MGNLPTKTDASFLMAFPQRCRWTNTISVIAMHTMYFSFWHNLFETKRLRAWFVALRVTSAERVGNYCIGTDLHLAFRLFFAKVDLSSMLLLQLQQQSIVRDTSHLERGSIWSHPEIPFHAKFSSSFYWFTLIGLQHFIERGCATCSTSMHLGHLLGEWVMHRTPRS